MKKKLLTGFALLFSAIGFAQNVGIGTTIPTTTLDVNGTLRIRGGTPGISKILTSDVDGVGQWSDLLPFNSVKNVATTLFNIENTSTGGNGAIAGATNSLALGIGVYGVAKNTNPSASTAGVSGINNSTNAIGIGVYGYHSGAGAGGSFGSQSGNALETSGKLKFGGNNIGILGVNKFLKSIDNVGQAEWSDLLPYNLVKNGATILLDIENTSTGGNGAISGTTNSLGLGIGVYGLAKNTSPGAPTAGVSGINNSTNAIGVGVYGYHSGAGAGGSFGSQSGNALETSGKLKFGGNNVGILGVNKFLKSIDNVGQAEWSDLLPLNSVKNESTILLNIENTSTGGNGAITGATNSLGLGIGVYGVAKNTSPNAPTAGVSGINNATNAIGVGVYGSHSGAGAGVQGNSSSGAGGNFSSSTGYALITGTGNVGIGIATPSSKMDIQGSSYLTHFYFGANEDTYIRGGKDGSKVLINDISGQGSVGIGIANPNQYLDVNGRMRIYHKGANSAGIWLGNAVNGLSGNDGAFIGINCSAAGSETAGIFIGGNWRFDVDRLGNGRFGGTVTASSGFACASDFRYKKNITSLKNSLENIRKINAVNYNWKINEYPDHNFSDKNQIGFIAQDLEKIYPEMVFTDDKGYKSVDYARLTPVLVEAVKDLAIKNDTQQIQLNDLKKELLELKEMINKINTVQVTSTVKN